MSCNHSHKHEHGHGHSHSHLPEDASTKNILIAFMLNFCFAIAEIAGGILTGSTAILSDAVHDFGDSIALFMSLVFSLFSNKKPTDKFTYGYKRLSVIGAIINILVLLFGTAFVIREAIERFLNPQSVVAYGMVLMSIFGIAINGISVLRMKNSQKILDKTVMLHLMEDLLGWLAVFVVSVIIYFTNLYILDPVLSLIICGVIFRNIWINTKTVVDIIMQAVPSHIDICKIKSQIALAINIPVEINEFNVWSLDGENNVATLKIFVKEKENIENNILDEIRHILFHNSIEHCTIEIER